MIQNKVAVIGCGQWGKNLVRNMAALGSLYVVCDQSADTAASFAAQYTVKTLSFEHILADADINAVMIASPSLLHAAMAEKALAAGKHVFIEKPLALSMADGTRLAQLASDKQLTLMVGHLLYYHAAFLKLAAMVKNGVIGAVQTVEARRLNRGPIRHNDNVLWDLASHDVAMVLAVLDGTPRDVLCLGSAIGDAPEDSALPFITDAHLHLEFASASAHIHVSWLAAEKEHKFIVIGDKGALVFDDTKPWEQKLALHKYALTPQPRQWLIDSQPPEYSAIAPDEPLGNECAHFLDCITSGAVPRSGSQHALQVIDILERAQNFHISRMKASS